MENSTFQLLWNHLRELFGNVSARVANFGKWYREEFSWKKIDFLDMFFVGWLLLSLVIVGSIHIFLKINGKLNKSNKVKSNLLSSGKEEPCQWVNSVISWFYVHYDEKPKVVDCWIRSLNEHLSKQSGEVKIKIEEILGGSVPPKFTAIRALVGPNDSLAVTAQVSDSDLTFLVSLSKSGNVSTSDVNVRNLAGSLKFELNLAAKYSREQVHVTSSFPVQPNMLVKARPKLQQEPDMPTSKLESLIFEAISKSLTCFSITPREGLQAAYQQTKDSVESLRAHNVRDILKSEYRISDLPHPNSETQSPFSSDPCQRKMWEQRTLVGKDEDKVRGKSSFGSQDEQLPMEKAPLYYDALKQSGQKARVNELKASLGKIDGNRPNKEFIQPTFTKPLYSKTPQMPPMKILPQGQQLLNSKPVQSQVAQREQKLLVKIIKANGLGSETGCSDPFCTVCIDSPAQKFVTSCVRSSGNPFFDEQFCFDLSQASNRLDFKLYDRKPSEDKFLGSSCLDLLDLQRNPSSRQIMPLISESGAIGSGSITAEFLFMSAAEASQILNSQLANSGRVQDAASPHRRVDKSTKVTPGGTRVTTTTTTTEKPREGNLNPSYSDSPGCVWKSENAEGPSLSRREQPFSYSSDSSPSPFGVEDRRMEDGRYAPELRNSDSAENLNESLTETALRQLAKTNQSQARRPITARSTPKTSTLIITGVQRASGGVYDEARMITPTTDLTIYPEHTQPESRKLGFVKTLKRTFRRKHKPRSNSADRASSLRAERPQTNSERLSPNPRTKYPSECIASEVSENAESRISSLRKARSSSLGGSLRRLFRKKKKNDFPSSRESSPSRNYDSREDSYSQQSPQLFRRQGAATEFTNSAYE